jgi:methionyl-tRNA formyltransferase
MSVVGRSIERQIAVGCTTQYVNPAIDRGAIIERRLVSLPDQARLVDLENAANDLAGEMAADMIAEAVRTGSVPSSAAQDAVHPLCRRLSSSERERLEQMVIRGDAEELFNAWREETVDGTVYRLPHDYQPPSTPNGG